jgi:hypothetical protein
LLAKVSDRLISGLWPATALVAVVVLTYLLWTGTPLFRWVAAGVLFLASSWALFEFLFTPISYVSLFLGLYALAGLMSAVLLLASPGARGYLARREAKRLGLLSAVPARHSPSKSEGKVSTG